MKQDVVTCGSLGKEQKLLRKDNKPFSSKNNQDIKTFQSRDVNQTREYCPEVRSDSHNSYQKKCMVFSKEN